jgi:Mor family transcriptional regulator
MSTDRSDPRSGRKPIFQEPAYPPLLREMGELVDRELRNTGIEPARAAAIAETVTEHTRENYGGQINYWPKGDDYLRTRRRLQMWERFTGDNYNQLAHDFGMGVQQVYKEIAKARRENTARTQRSLFDPEQKPS